LAQASAAASYSLQGSAATHLSSSSSSSSTVELHISDMGTAHTLSWCESNYPVFIAAP
jgi:hypothetical protein